MQMVSILALAALVVMGCSSGTAETGNQAQDEALTQNQTEASVNQTEALNETAPLTGAPSPVEETSAEAVPSARDDYSQAEARNLAATTSRPAVDTSKPAVNTSQLKMAPEWAL